MMKKTLETIDQRPIRKETHHTPSSRPKKGDFKAYFEDSSLDEKRLDQMFAVIPPETLLALKTLIAADKEEMSVAETNEMQTTGYAYLAQTSYATSSSVQSASFVRMSAEVQAIFDKMVDTITVMNTSSQSQTTISLQAPQFASSPFYGAEIIIEEFTHLAPKSFNIQLIASPQALAMMQANMHDLMAAFQNSNYNFKVNRLEMSVQNLPRNKEPVSRDKEEQEQTHE